MLRSHRVSSAIAGLLVTLALAPAGLGQVPLPPFVDSSDLCGPAITHYLEVRAAMNHCEVPNDCAEIYPGVCPQGPYYIDATSDMGPLRAVLDAINAWCILPECEPPMPLGPARCDAGRCVSGPDPGWANDDTCWSFDVHYLEHGQPGYLPHQEALSPTSPRAALGLSAPREVELRLTDHHGTLMEDDVLYHSAHNSAQLTPLAPHAPGVYRLSLDAGVHYFAATGAPGPYLRLQADWTPSDEVATHHATVHMRVCED